MPKNFDLRLESLVVRCILVLLLAVGLQVAAHADSYEDSLSSATRGDTAQLRDLLQRGIAADTIDEFGNSLLILAAHGGHVETVQLILKFRPDVNRRNMNGDSALMLASLSGNLELVNLLIESGAVFNHDGWTPLIYAAFEGKAEVVDMLLALGADVNALAPNQSNSLMFAARNGHETVVKRLLTTDINLDQINDRGETAETWALSNGNTDIAKLISDERIRRGGKPRKVLIEIQ